MFPATKYFTFAMSQIEQLDDAGYEMALRPIWNFLAVEDQPESSDIIFVFGGLDLTVPARAAHLYLNGFAPSIIVSGKAGPLTQHVFAQPEAYIFRDEMIKLGVPQEAIITEDQAANTLENVLLGMRVLEGLKISVKKALLVAKPFLMRRCFATFQKQYPSINLICCPPKGTILEFCDRPRKEFAERLLAELGRIETYSQKGDITPQSLSEEIRTACANLQTFLL